LTTNSNNNNQLNLFFLQPSSLNSNTIAFKLRPTQSLISLIEPSSSPPPPPLPPRPARPSGQTLPSASRVADIIHQFETHSRSSMSNNQNKVTPPIRSVFTKQWEGNSSRTSHTFVVETPSTSIALNSKKNNKPQPIIIYERVTNHDRPYQSVSTPPPVSPKSPLVKTWLQNRTKSQQNIESDTDSAIHTMVAVINTDMNDSTILSRSNTTDSTCSSSLSSSISPSIPHFALPTIASTQKQRDITSNSTSFKRTCSPPPRAVATFTRTISSTPSIPNEDLEPSHSSSLSTHFLSSEENLVDQYRRLPSPETIQSDTNLTRNSTTQVIINTNLPLKYKRDILIRLYG